VTVRNAVAVRATGLEFGGAAVTTLIATAEPTVTARFQRPFVTTGPLAPALGAAGWVELADVGGFSTYVNPKAAPPYSVSAAGATVKVVSGDAWTGAVSVQVTSPRSASLVRNVADVPGWHATVSQGGKVVRVPVDSDGLIQEVAVPSGTSTVTFFYVALGWREGQMVALGGALAFAALILAIVVSARRRRLGEQPPDLTEADAPSLAPA
jgi:hypothetical protein